MWVSGALWCLKGRMLVVRFETTFMLVLQPLKVIGYRHWFGFTIHFSFSPSHHLSSADGASLVCNWGKEPFNSHKELFQIKRFHQVLFINVHIFRAVIQVFGQALFFFYFVRLGKMAISNRNNITINIKCCVWCDTVIYVALWWNWKVLKPCFPVTY